jgi:protein involved in polysaccharide export with SLBB domain
VGTPAIYELKPDTTLEDVLGYAGGLSQPAARDKAILERFDKQPMLHSDNIELTPEALKMQPHDGDIVRILPVVPRFERTVTLRGNVADPVRYPWRPGLKVSDLIPDPDRLLTRGYWNARNALLKRENLEPLYKQEAAKNNGGSSLAAAVMDDQSVIKEFVRQTDLQPLAPNIDWSYATIERLDSKDLGTHLLSFNLKAAVLNHDPSADLVLEPNDIVTVFSDADIALPRLQQIRYVRVEGEVSLAGVYSVRPGETLRDIVAKAGGLTSNAYLYGAQFTRESTRKEQQRRFGDYLDTLERDMVQHGSTSPSNGALANRAAADEIQLVSQRQLIERLRRTPITGRIVLDLHPNSGAVDALPELPLENGDTLLVPSTPSTVNVLGMVYNQGSFVYSSGLSLRDYLAHSGGPSRYADRKHVFVIRADGSVVAKDSRSKLFFNDFESLPMYPGDTIVVPAYVKKGTFMNTFVNWSQIVGSLGVSAAAVNVLR